MPLVLQFFSQSQNNAHDLCRCCCKLVQTYLDGMEFQRLEDSTAVMPQENPQPVKKANAKIKPLDFSVESTRRCIAVLTTVHINSQLTPDTSAEVSVLDDQSRPLPLFRNVTPTHVFKFPKLASPVDADSPWMLLQVPSKKSPRRSLMCVPR